MASTTILYALLNNNKAETMHQKTRISFLLMFMLMACLNGEAQKRLLRKADTLFSDLQLVPAIEQYHKLAEKTKADSTRHYARFRIAECYRMMHRLDSALVYYGNLKETGFARENPDIFYHYASINQMHGQMDTAREYYLRCLEYDPGNKMAANGIASCDWIAENTGHKPRYRIEHPDSINSGYDDFAPAFLVRTFDQLVFTSNRKEATGEEMDMWTGGHFTDLFKTKLEDDGWTTPEPIDTLNVINRDANEGTPSLDGSYRSMYFTRCRKQGLNRSYCQILKTTKLETKWSMPQIVFSDTAANMGHPGISKDELTIAFSSDRPGGEGKHDIWVAQRKNKVTDFGYPKNIGDVINTAGDDMFPYIFNDTILFFASNGHPGYGGLDIFYSVKKDEGWSEPVNLLTPINSSYDDFGVIYRSLFEIGYFSSNRTGGAGGDDIFQLIRIPFKFRIKGHVKDAGNLLSLTGLPVLLINESGDTVQVETDQKGNFLFDRTMVLEDHAYELIAAKEGYFTEKEYFETHTYEDDHDFYVEIELEPIPEEPIVLPDILYKLDEWVLEPQYEDSLMQLVEILNENENLVIELRSHTDSRASYEYNDELSQKRAQSVVDFLINQGIDPGRLEAKGYGERVFRVLDKDITRDGYLFRRGTELNDQYVYSLPTKEMQEAAFQLNRRTEFAVLAMDYTPEAQPKTGVEIIQVLSDTVATMIDFGYTDDGQILIGAIINGYRNEAILSPGSPESLLAESIAIELLAKGALKRLDFQGEFERIVKDDRIADNTLLHLEKVRMGDVLISNVKVRVLRDIGDYLIVGSDIMDQAGEYEIDEEKRVIIFK
jgi:peptidoglycan-associated lipoprotein